MFINENHAASRNVIDTLNTKGVQIERDWRNQLQNAFENGEY